MEDEWKISSQEELGDYIQKLITMIKNSQVGNDPEVLKLLEQLEMEHDMPKHYAILAKIVLFIGEREENTNGC